MLSDVQRHVTNDSALRTERDAIMNAFDEHPDRPTCNVNDFMDEILSRTKGAELTDTIDWATQLRHIVGSPLCGQRPFVCDGYPTESHILIIGTNPATPLNMDWWDWWISDHGFDYDLFMSRYINARRRMHKSLLGATRRRFIRITDTLQSEFRLNLKSIETNVYRREARSEEQLWQYDERDRYPNNDVLHLLISGLQTPRVVIPHGASATAWIFERAAKLPPNIEIPNRTLPHLSKTTDADISYICEWTRNLLHK